MGYRRLPSKQTEYMTIVGELLTDTIIEILEQLGFVLNLKPQQENGVDLEVFLILLELFH